MKSIRLPLGVLFLGSLLALGCAERNEGPEVASSASQVGYAANYPAELQRVSGEASTQLEVANGSAEEMQKFPDALTDPDWQIVLRVYEHADEEGRGQAYATRFEEASVINRFFAQEEQALSSRVAGSVQHAAKEKGCDAEFYGPAKWGLEKGIEKQIEERMRAESEAHALIDRSQDELGRANVETLHTQADKISMASYVVHLRSEFIRRELEEVAEQASDIRGTLSDRIEELKQADEPDQERIARLEQSLAKLEEVQPQAEQTLKQAEQQAEQAREAYDKALDSLLEKVRTLAEQQQAAS